MAKDKPDKAKPKADKPKADKPKADKPKADKPKADKPKAVCLTRDLQVGEDLRKVGDVLAEVRLTPGCDLNFLVDAIRCGFTDRGESE